MKIKILFSFVSLVAMATAFTRANAADFKGLVACSNMKDDGAPFTPDEVFLIPYVDYRGKTAWLFTTGDLHVPPFSGKDRYTFGKLEAFDVGKMESLNSTARVEERYKGVLGEILVFTLPEYDSSVWIRFECRTLASREDLADFFTTVPNKAELARFLEKLAEYGPEPR